MHDIHSVMNGSYTIYQCSLVFIHSYIEAGAKRAKAPQFLLSLYEIVILPYMIISIAPPLSYEQLPT